MGPGPQGKGNEEKWKQCQRAKFSGSHRRYLIFHKVWIGTKYSSFFSSLIPPVPPNHRGINGLQYSENRWFWCLLFHPRPSWSYSKGLKNSPGVPRTSRDLSDSRQHVTSIGIPLTTQWFVLRVSLETHRKLLSLLKEIRRPNFQRPLKWQLVTEQKY